MEKRKRLNYLDGIRFFAVLLVVISHFNHSMEQFQITICHNNYIISSIFANGDFGTLGVSLFFIISGFSLFYNYENDFDIKTYLKKRFLNIYPQFWCSYLLVFFVFFLKYKEFWFEANEQIPPSRFVLSILGMDGYFLYLGKNFYLIGEWFLGCIIFLYLLFPMLRIMVKKYPAITWGIATVVYVLVIIYNPFKIGLTRNLLIRGYDFLIGMLLVKYIPRLDSKRKIGISIICALIFLFGIGYSISKLQMCMITITGISLFLLFIFIFEKIDLGKLYFVKVINKYSYDIFLLHHITLSLCFSHFARHEYSLYEGVVLVFTYVVGLCILIKIESFLLKNFLAFIKRRFVIND